MQDLQWISIGIFLSSFELDSNLFVVQKHRYDASSWINQVRSDVCSVDIDSCEKQL